LLPQHARLLRQSAIDPEIARERGYRSISPGQEKLLRIFHFEDYQVHLPALVFTLRNPRGEVAGYMLRPDHPRLRKKKPIKYEAAAGSKLCVDTPLRLTAPASGGLPPIKDPDVALFVTEGARKADSAVSIGLCCVSLNGVYGWRDRKGPLADWEEVPL